MKVQASYRAGVGEELPTLVLSIIGAPHRRMHHNFIQGYRHAVHQACWEAGIHMPISSPLDLKVWFIDPSSPDLDNLLTALYQALDGSRVRRKDRIVLMDDGLVQGVDMKKVWINKSS